MRITAFTHDWQPIGDLDKGRMLSAKVIEEVNGEHAIVIETTQELAKDDRLLWRDDAGIWHEYVVYGISSTRLGPTVVAHTYYCPWSVQVDLDETTTTAMPGTSGVPASATVALRGALQGTSRWTVGTVEPTTLASASFWRKSGWEAMQTLVETWGGELRADITVTENWAVTRRVSLLNHVGSETPTRRYDYGHDVVGITRDVLEQPWTCRVIPLGAGEELDSGGYGRKITIEDVNGGVDYLEDAEVVPLVRKPDGSGGWEYPVQHVENPNAKTPAELKAWAQANLHEWTRPKVSYELDVVQLAQAGTSGGVACGDEVIVVDTAFGESGVQMETRCVRVEVDLLDPSQNVVTLSNVPSSLGSQLASIAQAGQTALDMIANSGERQASSEYVSDLIARLNEQANLTGGYTYTTEGEGIRTYDAPVSDPAVGAEATKVVEIKGGNIRIADSKDSQGNWQWKTVIVSGHVASELVTAAQLVAGTITSANGTVSIDLDNDTIEVGGKALTTVIQDVDGLNTLVRDTADGTLVVREGADFAALVDASGAFEVVYVTWQDGEPTLVAPWFTVDSNGARYVNYGVSGEPHFSTDGTSLEVGYTAGNKLHYDTTRGFWLSTRSGNAESIKFGVQVDGTPYGANAYRWHEIATTTGTTPVSLDLYGLVNGTEYMYSELMVFMRNGTNYWSSMVVPVAQLTSTQVEWYMGGGVWASSAARGRTAVFRISSSIFTPVGAYVDGTAVTPDWVIYAR